MKLQTIIQTILKRESCESQFISATYCGDKRITTLNAKYLQHHYPTDTLTFRLNEGKKIEGEFYISIHALKRNAKRFHVPFVAELFRVTVHSTLHLVGYEDKSDHDKCIMTKEENYYLKMLNFN